MGAPRDDNPLAPLPPLLFPAANSTERRWHAALKAAGRIRAVGPRLYVSVSEAKTAATLRQSWSTIVAHLHPDAFITHRTALDFRPSPCGDVFLTAASRRVVEYPGLVLRFIKGPEPLPDDPKVLTLRMSSVARALLENLLPEAAARTRALSIEEIEARLEQLLHVHGEAQLNLVRDRAKTIAAKFRWATARARLDGMIGALLGTQPATLASSAGRARAAGEPFDPPALERIQQLFAELRTPPPVIAEPTANSDHARNKAFFEAYFSNFIEGTRFEIEEAEAIIFDRHIPPKRPLDAHDIIGTFAVVANPVEMRRTATSFEAFLQLLQARHHAMLSQRPEAQPGEWKTKPNRAGDTHFVHPDYVRGTLRKGWEVCQSLAPGLPRAILLAFLITDVHPFSDGNGRIARIMMNAELVAAGHSTIIIPTVFRDDYLLALRALTRRHRPAPIVATLRRAQRLSNLTFTPYPTILKELTRRHWFREPDEARIVDE